MTLEKSMESLLNKNEQFYNVFRKSYLSFFYVIENDFCWLNSIEIFINGYEKNIYHRLLCWKDKILHNEYNKCCYTVQVKLLQLYMREKKYFATIWFKADFSFYWSMLVIFSCFNCLWVLIFITDIFNSAVMIMNISVLRRGNSSLRT